MPQKFNITYDTIIIDLFQVITGEIFDKNELTIRLELKSIFFMKFIFVVSLVFCENFCKKLKASFKYCTSIESISVPYRNQFSKSKFSKTTRHMLKLKIDSDRARFTLSENVFTIKF